MLYDHPQQTALDGQHFRGVPPSSPAGIYTLVRQSLRRRAKPAIGRFDIKNSLNVILPMTTTANSVTTQARWKSLRLSAAQNLAALAVATESFVRWSDTGIGERLFLAAFAGFVTQVMLSVGFYVAVSVVAWVGGDEVSLKEFGIKNPVFNGALLLAVGGISLGNRRVDNKVEKIIECVRKSEQSADLQRGIEPGAIIKWCADGYERDSYDFDQ